ncbi:hypothetical protein Taro_037551, partial [Colocasia esculenta]|nr:hypothetical protein [Colocasia esculenta]
MMELLVEVFLVRRTVADRSGAVLLVVVGCVFGCMCFVVAERVCLWCGFHWCRFVACGSSELWVPCVLLELFLACSGGGFSQNFFVLVSVLLPSRLSVLLVGWSVLICVDRLFGVFVLVELSLDDSLSFLVEVLSRTAYCLIARFVFLGCVVGNVVCAVAMRLAVLLVEFGAVVLCFCALALWCMLSWPSWESLWLAPCRFGAVGATMCTTPGGSGARGVELFRLWDACGDLFLAVVLFVLEGAGARVRSVCVVPLVVSSVSN